MTGTASPALRTAPAYCQARTSHNLDKAMSYIAGGTPAGCLEGAEAYRSLSGPFAQIVTGATVIAAFGDDHTGLVMYDTQTAPAARA